MVSTDEWSHILDNSMGGQISRYQPIRPISRYREDYMSKPVVTEDSTKKRQSNTILDGASD